jgi:hypothetical protein
VKLRSIRLLHTFFLSLQTRTEHFQRHSFFTIVILSPTRFPSRKPYKMYLSKTIVSIALLAPLAAALSSDPSTTDIATDILTAADSSPESSYSVNPTVVQTDVAVATASTTPAGSGALPNTATTSIPTNILTAPDSDPSGAGIGSMSTVIATATLQQSQDASASTPGAASPTPTDDAAGAILRSPASILGALLVSLLVPLF